MFFPTDVLLCAVSRNCKRHKDRHYIFRVTSEVQMPLCLPRWIDKFLLYFLCKECRCFFRNEFSFSSSWSCFFRRWISFIFSKSFWAEGLSSLYICGIFLLLSSSHFRYNFTLPQQVHCFINRCTWLDHSRCQRTCMERIFASDGLSIHSRLQK